MTLVAFVFLFAGIIVGAVPAYLWGRGSTLGDKIQQLALEVGRLEADATGRRGEGRRTATLDPGRWPDYPPAR